MKKIFLMLLAVGCISGATAYASASPATRVFMISYPVMFYMYWNDQDSARQFRLLVEPEINGKPADKVTLRCNGAEVDVLPGSSAACDVNPHKPVSFIVTAKNFKNGARGVSEKSF